MLEQISIIIGLMVRCATYLVAIIGFNIVALNLEKFQSGSDDYFKSHPFVTLSKDQQYIKGNLDAIMLNTIANDKATNSKNNYLRIALLVAFILSCLESFFGFMSNIGYNEINLIYGICLYSFFSGITLIIPHYNYSNWFVDISLYDNSSFLVGGMLISLFVATSLALLFVNRTPR